MKQWNLKSAKWVAVAMVVSLVVPQGDVLGYGSGYKADTFPKKSARLTKAVDGSLSEAGKDKPATADDVRKKVDEILAQKNISDEQKAQFKQFIDSMIRIGQYEQAILQARQLDVEDAEQAQKENDALRRKAAQFKTPQAATSALNLGNVPKECEPGQLNSSAQSFTKAVTGVITDMGKHVREGLAGIAKDDEEALDKFLEESEAKFRKAIGDALAAEEKSESWEDDIKKARKDGDVLSADEALDRANDWAKKKENKLLNQLVTDFFKSARSIRDRRKREDEIAAESTRWAEGVNAYINEAEAPGNQFFSAAPAACLKVAKSVHGGADGVQPGGVNLRGKQGEYLRTFSQAFARVHFRPGAVVIDPLTGQPGDPQAVLAQQQNQIVQFWRGRGNNVGACPTTGMQTFQNAITSMRGATKNMEGITDPDAALQAMTDTLSGFGTRMQEVHAAMNSLANSCRLWAEEANFLQGEIDALAQQGGQGAPGGVPQVAGGPQVGAPVQGGFGARNFGSQHGI